MTTPVSICVIGSGYVGLVAAVCFAEMGHKVMCVDNDEDKVEMLRAGGVPIYEGHLPELLARHRGRGVEFTTDLARPWGAARLSSLPWARRRATAARRICRMWRRWSREIARAINGYKVIVEKSTVPVYTNEWIRRVLHRHGVEPRSFDVVSNPEFLREGTAIIDFLHPDRIVVGADTERAAEVLRRIYAPLTGGSYYAQAGALPGACSAAQPATLLVTSAQSAEIIKHASNAFLALKISFINAVANLAEAWMPTSRTLPPAWAWTAASGRSFCAPGLGYGGSCFPKDVAASTGWPSSAAWTSSCSRRCARSTRRRGRSSSTRCGRRCGRCAASGWRRWAWRSRATRTTSASRRPSTWCRSCWRPARMVTLTIRRRWSAPARSCRRERQLTLCGETSTKRRKDADAVLILTDWEEFGALDLARLQPGGAVSHRDRRAQSVQSAADDGARLYVCERRAAGATTARSKASRASWYLGCQPESEPAFSLNETLTMRVLVTGAAGFLGSHLTDRAAGAGPHRGGRGQSFHRQPRESGSPGAMSRASGSRSGTSASHSMWARVDYVFNLASPASPPEYLRLAHRDAASRLAGHREHAGVGAPIWRGPSACLHVGVLRRPGGASADRGATGAT